MASLFAFAMHALKNGPPESDDDDDGYEEEEEEEEEAAGDDESNADDGDSEEEEEGEGMEEQEDENNDGDEAGDSNELGEEENQEHDPIVEVAEEASNETKGDVSSMRRLRSKSSSFGDLHTPDRQYVHPDEKKLRVPENDCVIVSETATLSVKVAQRQRLATLLKQIEQQRPLDSNLQHACIDMDTIMHLHS